MIDKLVYVSRALSPTPLDLKDILFTAREANPVLGVTGTLCFLDGVYIQHLEGESSKVNALYQKIEKDPRHKDAKILVHEQIAQREHPNWSMALLTWNEETKAIFRLFNRDSACDAYAIDPVSVVSLLHAWSRTSNWMIV